MNRSKLLSQAGGRENLNEEIFGHGALREYTIWARVAVGKDAGAAPFGLRVRVFLRRGILFGKITEVATCILLLSVVTGAIHFWGRGVHATGSCESWRKFDLITVFDF